MEMKTEYRRDLQHTWMILYGGKVPEKEDYSVRMLTENRIGGLVPCKTVSLDGRLRFYYDISSRHALRTVLETEPVTHVLLEQILGSLARVMERLSEYLLDPDGLLLDPMYLFWNPERSEIRFCWYPGNERKFREEAKVLGSALLAQLDQTDRAGVVMGYQFYQYCESGELTPAALRGLMRPELPEKEKQTVTKEEIERAAILDSFFDESEEEESGFRAFGHRVRSWFSGKRRKRERPELAQDTEKEYDIFEKSGMNRGPAFGESESLYRGSMQRENPFADGMTTYPGTPKNTEMTKNAGMTETAGPSENTEAAGYAGKQEQTGPIEYRKLKEHTEGAGYDDRSAGAETTILTPDMLMNRRRKIWVLRIKERRGKEREFQLTENVYFVGKSGAGGTLPLDSPAVSRLHAKIEKSGENWCLMDMNSKNGTRWIRLSDDGSQTESLLQPDQTAVLQEGDVIWFADVMCQVIRQ